MSCSIFAHKGTTKKRYCQIMSSKPMHKVYPIRESAQAKCNEDTGRIEGYYSPTYTKRETAPIGNPSFWGIHKSD